MITRLAYEFLKSRPYKKVMIRHKGSRINAEVADSFTKQMVGLMYRKDIGGNSGMLFPLFFSSKSAASIIMMNMRFSIDIVWMDVNRRIVDMFRNAKPAGLFGKSYTPKTKSRYVLELKTGTASRLGMKIGDRLDF